MHHHHPRRPLTLISALGVALAASWIPVVAQNEIVVDNDRVTVRQVAGDPRQMPADTQFDRVLIGLKNGDAEFVPRGVRAQALTEQSQMVVVSLKEHPVPPLATKSGYPNAFPRPGVRKLEENERVIIWDYKWIAGVATPMHFHDKDVVVVYLADGALKSTTPDGTDTINDHYYGFAKFNARDRTHSETLVRGTARAIIIELK